MSANNIFIPLITFREKERNMIDLGLKSFCPDYKKYVTVRSVLQTPFGTYAINSTTNPHLPVVSDQNQRKFIEIEGIPPSDVLEARASLSML